MQIELVNKREEYIMYVALAFLKRCNMTDEALKVCMQCIDNPMEYRHILDKEIDKILDKLGKTY